MGGLTVSPAILPSTGGLRNPCFFENMDVQSVKVR